MMVSESGSFDGNAGCAEAGLGVEGGAKRGLSVEFRRIWQTHIGKDVAAAADHSSCFTLSYVLPLRQPSQYFCTLGSISSAQAKMPPARLTTLG